MLRNNVTCLYSPLTVEVIDEPNTLGLCAGVHTAVNANQQP